MKRANSTNIGIVLFLSILIFSCTKSSTETTPATPPINSDEITYDSNVEPIISRECKGCHSGSSPSGNLKLETYSQVRSSTENGNLLNRINNVSNPMPQSGLMPLADRNIILDWSNNNYLEN